MFHYCYNLIKITRLFYLYSHFVLWGYTNFCVVLLCVFTFCISCYDVRYDFRMKTMFVSSLPPVVCRMAHVLFKCLFVYSGANTYRLASFSGQSIFDCPFGIL
jgi:hypothetical protein